MKDLTKNQPPKINSESKFDMGAVISKKWEEFEKWRKEKFSADSEIRNLLDLHHARTEFEGKLSEYDKLNQELSSKLESLFKERINYERNYDKNQFFPTTEGLIASKQWKKQETIVIENYIKDLKLTTREEKAREHILKNTLESDLNLQYYCETIWNHLEKYTDSEKWLDDNQSYHHLTNPRQISSYPQKDVTLREIEAIFIIKCFRDKDVSDSLKKMKGLKDYIKEKNESVKKAQNKYDGDLRKLSIGAGIVSLLGYLVANAPLDPFMRNPGLQYWIWQRLNFPRLKQELVLSQYGNGNPQSAMARILNEKYNSMPKTIRAQKKYEIKDLGDYNLNREQQTELITNLIFDVPNVYHDTIGSSPLNQEEDKRRLASRKAHNQLSLNIQKQIAEALEKEFFNSKKSDNTEKNQVFTGIQVSGMYSLSALEHMKDKNNSPGVKLPKLDTTAVKSQDDKAKAIVNTFLYLDLPTRKIDTVAQIPDFIKKNNKNKTSVYYFTQNNYMWGVIAAISEPDYVTHIPHPTASKMDSPQVMALMY